MAATRELNSLINNARTVAALEAHARRVLARIEKQLIAGVSAASSQQIAGVVRKLNDIVSSMGVKGKTFMKRWITRNIESAFVLGDDAATRQLREQFKKALADPKGIKAGWGSVNQTSLRTMTAAMEATMGTRAEQMKHALGKLVRDTQTSLNSNIAIQRATINGVIRRATGRQLRDDIASIFLRNTVSPEVRKRLASIGFRGRDFGAWEEVARGQIITVGKIRINVASYSELVARTQMREAHTVAGIARLQQNQIDHVQISNHAQDKPDECTPWAGNVYYIGEGDDSAGFPPLSSVLNGGPPFHPRCVHVIRPYVIVFKTADAIQKDLDATNALPKRFFGKESQDIRRLVKETSAKDLRKIAPRGASDIKKKKAA